MIVAASVPGCIAYEGALLPAATGYLLSPDCVHESKVFDQPTTRSFLRIAFHEDEAAAAAALREMALDANP